jgi:hypothetical protein
MAAGVAFAMFGGPHQLRFWPLEGASDLMERVMPLVLIALFTERALEVFVTAWRGPAEKVLKTVEAADGLEAKKEIAAYKGETQRIAFTAGIALGVLVSATGVRCLALLLYPDEIEALTGTQMYLFNALDVLITGAVIGGGAEGIHKIVKVFTTFLETSSAKIEKQKPAEAPVQ